MKTKAQTRKNKRNYLIITLIVIMLLLGVGYAVFQQTLNITGNVAGQATWNVHFVSGATTDKDGAAVAGTLSNSDHTLTISVDDLQYPGDAREVTAVIKNDSSMPIKLTGFAPTAPADADITFDYVDLTSKVSAGGAANLTATAVDASTKEVIPAGGTCTYKFIIGWNKASTKTALTSSTYSFSFTYEQNTIAPVLTPDHTGHTMGS